MKTNDCDCYVQVIPSAVVGLLLAVVLLVLVVFLHAAVAACCTRAGDKAVNCFESAPDELIAKILNSCDAE